MSTIHGTDKGFQDLLTKKSTIVIDFYADWCYPCKMMGPIFEGLSDDEDLKNATFVKVNVDEEPGLAGQFQVMSIPTFAIIKTEGNGQFTVVEKMIGGQDPLNFKAKIESNL